MLYVTTQHQVKPSWVVLAQEVNFCTFSIVAKREKGFLLCWRIRCYFPSCAILLVSILLVGNKIEDH